MDIHVEFARTIEDEQAVTALLEEIAAEHAQVFGEDDDGDTLDDGATGRVLIAKVGDEIVGAARLHLGADGPFPSAYESHYALDRVQPRVERERMLLLSDLAVPDTHDREEIGLELIHATVAYGAKRGCTLVFTHCRPPVLGLYKNLGFRSYTAPFEVAGHGTRIPLMIPLDDLEHLERTNSPYLKLLRNEAPSESELNPPSAASDAAWWRDVYRLFHNRSKGDTFLEGLEPDQVSWLLEKSRALNLAAGQQLIHRGDDGREMFLILSGNLEIRIEDSTIAWVAEGDVIGEIAFLLASPRSTDVFAGPGGARVLSLSEDTLYDIIEHDAVLASNLLLNLAKALCWKVVRQNIERKP
jgi:hypothetical protein